MNQTNIIIDTDLGDDIDDAFAILLALASPEVHVLGITTVYRCPEARAKMTASLLRQIGEEVNIYCGAKYPICNRSAWGRPINFETLPWSYSSDYEKETFCPQTAFEFYCQVLETRNDVVIIALGPLTNLAELFTKRADLIGNIRKIVVMGGAFTMNRTEYNMVCDPEAAKIVLESDCPIDVVGLDVTLQCKIKNDALEELWRRGGVFETLHNMRRLWGHQVILHDPLALMSIICEDVVSFEPAVIGVETKGEYTRGMTLILSDGDWKVSKESTATRVAVGGNIPRFKKELFARLSVIQKHA